MRHSGLIVARQAMEEEERFAVLQPSEGRAVSCCERFFRPPVVRLLRTPKCLSARSAVSSSILPNPRDSR